MTIKNFAIYGERCSGTNFLEETIKHNFNIKITLDYGHKHFFCFQKYTNDTKENETLFIGIIKHPINWLFSLLKNPHHLNVKYLPNLLTQEIYSTYDVTIGNEIKGEIRKDDLNYITNEKYKNIFELRKLKNDYLINIMPTKVKNYIFIKYEDLVLKPEEIIINIQKYFDLKLKNDVIKKVTYYKKYSHMPYVPRVINFDNKTLDIIKQNLDKNQEELLNYDIN